DFPRMGNGAVQRCTGDCGVTPAGTTPPTSPADGTRWPAQGTGRAPLAPSRVSVLRSVLLDAPSAALTARSQNTGVPQRIKPRIPRRRHWTKTHSSRSGKGAHDQTYPHLLTQDQTLSYSL